MSWLSVKPYSPIDRMYSFSPVVGSNYFAYIEGDEDKKIRIEFTNECIGDDERMLGFEPHECWDEEETRYVYHIDEYGNHIMKTKTIDGDIIELIVKEILTKDEIEIDTEK